MFKKSKKIYYAVTSNEEFLRFRCDSYASGLYPYSSDDIYGVYIHTRQNTTLLPGDTIELKWHLTDTIEPWLNWMLLLGYPLTVR
jgi:hypothetical protein